MSVLEEAVERRQAARAKYLRDYLKIGGPQKNFTAFATTELVQYIPPDRRLAFGVGFSPNHISPGLAIRPGKKGGIAERAAFALREDAERDGSWADVRIVESLSTPSRAEVGAPIKSRSGFPVGGDPLVLGASVSHPKAPAGSLGGFVRFGEADAIIGACHVMANAGRGIELEPPHAAPYVYHPASSDARRLVATNRIGQLREFVPLDTSSVEVDAAVAVLSPHRSHSGNVVPPVKGARDVGSRIKGPSSEKAFPQGGVVAKVGRTTHYTEGNLTAALFNDVTLDVSGLGIVYYDQMFEIESADEKTPFAQPGDSGAVVFDIATKEAFGLVVGGGVWDDGGKSRTLVYACSLHEALRQLGASWL